MSEPQATGLLLLFVALHWFGPDAATRAAALDLGAGVAVLLIVVDMLKQLK